MFPAIISGVLAIFDRILPEDPTKKAEAQAQLVQLMQQQDFELSKAQIEINKIDAASGNKFQSSWRPLLAYVCIAGFAYATLFRPMIIDLLYILHLNASVLPSLPEINNETLTTLLYALLGLGGLRTVEKVRK